MLPDARTGSDSEQRPITSDTTHQVGAGQTVRLPLLLVFFGLTTTVAGLVCCLVALYITGVVSTLDGPGATHVHALLGEQLSLLFNGGLFTLLGRWVLMMAGGAGLLT